MLDRLTRFLVVGLLSGVLALAPVLPAWSQAALLPNAKQTFFDADGNPLSSGKVYMYVPNTQQFKTTWENSTQTTPNTNPVVLDAAGTAIIYGQGSYQQKLEDVNGNLIWNAPTTAWNSAAPSGATGTDTAPVGTIVPFPGFVVPTNWALADGSTIDRTTYSDLYDVITIEHESVSCTSGSPTLAGWPDTSQMRVGAPIEASACVPVGAVIESIPSSSSITMDVNATATATVTARVFPWGNGNGTTTFTLPDLRGRVAAGPDAMGGTAANRLQITSTINTTSGSVVAAVPVAAGVNNGMAVTSANVPAGTVVSEIVTVRNTTMTSTSGSADVTVANVSGIVPGMTVTGVNIPVGTTVLSIAGSVVTLSASVATVTSNAFTGNGSPDMHISSSASALGLAVGMSVTAGGGRLISSIDGNVVTISGNATSSGTVAVTYSGAYASLPVTFSAATNLGVVLSNAATATASGTSAVFSSFTSASSVGASGGTASRTITVAEAPSGLFSLADPGHSHTMRGTVGGVTGNGYNNTGSFTYGGTFTSQVTQGATGISLTDMGGNVPVPLIQPTLTVNFIIKIKPNATGAGGVISLGGMFGDIACDATFLCSEQGSVNTIGLAQQISNTMLANISSDTISPVAITNTQWLDATISSTRGTLIYRDATNWSPLSVGSADQFLKSDGTDPVWADLPVASAVSPGIVQGDGDTLTITGGVIECTIMTSSQTGCARPDGVTIQMVGDVMTAVGAATASIGVSTTTVAAGTDGFILYNNAGVLGNASLSDLIDTGISSTSGSLLYRSATQWDALPPGSSGSVLTLVGTDPTWVSGGAGVTSVSSTNGTLSVSPTTGAVEIDLDLAHANTWTGAQTFSPTALRIGGSGSVYTTLATSASATNYTATMPAADLTVAALNISGQTVSGGATVSSLNLGTTVSPTVVPVSCQSRPIQRVSNAGAFSLVAPSHDGSCMVFINNLTGAGAVTFSGFTMGSSTGSTISTTAGFKYTVSVWRISSTSGYTITAHQ